MFPVNDSEYSQVCGKVTAYRWGYTFGFTGFLHRGQTIDGYYVDGLSLTHGSPRSHIWTFASGQWNGTWNDYVQGYRCPCDPGSTISTPSFVNNDYFCDSVATRDNYSVDPLRFYPDNALWDGQNLLNPCYGLNNPPWFYKTFLEPTLNDIELRICFNNGGSSSNVAIELLEIYIQ